MKPVAIIAFLLSVTSLADAAEFHLVDGSVVIGSIVRLTDGEDLVVDTEHMDEVVIEWASVTQLRNTEVVDVELFDGRRFAGQLKREGADIEISGDPSVRVAADNVYWIEEYNETFRDGFSAETDLGMNIVRGNNQVTQLSVGAGLGYDGQRFETSLRASTIINEQVESTDTRRSTLTGSYTHKFKGGWRAIGSLQFEADEQQDLDGRTVLAGGLGKPVFNERRHRLVLFSGLAINQERFSGLPRNETLEGLVGGIYRMRSFADIDASLTVFPNLEDDERVRVEFDASMSFDLYNDLDFKITVYESFLSLSAGG